MLVAGIDLGGTKCAVSVFDASRDWRVVDTQRVATPEAYDALLEVIIGQVRWARRLGAVVCGVAVPGLTDAHGRAVAANIPVSGRAFQQDILKAVAPISWMNDSRALALSEAVFGAGKGAKSIVSLTLGTGVAGAAVRDGQLVDGPSGCAGEYGHLPAPLSSNIPVRPGAFGRDGCYEQYISGPGLAWLASHVLGKDMTPEAVVAARADEAEPVWRVWCGLVAQLCLTLTTTLDPERIVLGGGLSAVPGVADDVAAALAALQFSGFAVPDICVAEGGPESGAQGVAYAAMREAEA